MQQLLDIYAAVLVAAVIGFLLIAIALLASRILAPFSSSPEKSIAFECGMLPVGQGWSQITVRYYLLAILFLLFDIEAVFIFPWVVAFVGVGSAAFWGMVIFIVLLAAGEAYAWKKGVLKWT